MKKKFEEVYQFRIDLLGIKPPIWRIIQVPETDTFWDLHVAIQSAMGWTDSHLHLFEINDPKTGAECEIGIPEEEGFFGDKKTLPGWEQKIADYFFQETVAGYLYDFGDNWQLMIKLEKILLREKGVNYPRCLGGERACPPEDCGGVGGYEDFLEAIKDPRHEEHEEMLEWIGEEFNPELFDAKAVVFIDPDKHRQEALG